MELLAGCVVDLPVETENARRIGRIEPFEASSNSKEAAISDSLCKLTIYAWALSDFSGSANPRKTFTSCSMRSRISVFSLSRFFTFSRP